MKKNVLSILLLSSSLFCNTAFAQLSQGGKPVSFEKHFQTTAVIKFENLPTVDVTALKAEDAINDQNKGPFRFGFNHFVNYNLSNSGAWTTLANGDKMWQLGIRSKDALSMNLAFDDYYMPDGAKLFIYTADKSFVIGAFTSQNNDASKMFATDLLPGEAIVIEYYEPAAVANPGRLNLFRVTHGYRGVVEYAQKSFGGSGACQVNVNCPTGTNWQDEKRGVVCLVVGGSEFCTGSLVNDVPQDGKPYVLTANHCSGSNDWATWVFRFNWEAPGCTNPGSSPSTTQSLNASTLRARSAVSDFCLVEITGGLSGGTVPAAYATYFNGWSKINTPASSVVGIHHPNGDIKKISEALNATTTASWGNPAADTWQVGQWTTACTEPGSSGSPLFDQNHRIIGQLYGGPSSCGASAANNHDNYGKFSTSWLGGGTSATQLKVWLDPGNTGATTTDGFDPNAIPPGFTNDAGIQTVNNPATGYSSCNTSLTPSVTLKNFGSSSLTSCTINYKVDAGTLQTYSWSGSLTTAQTATFTLPVMNGISPASHTFNCYTSNPNSNTDGNTANDAQTTNFTIISASPVVLTPQTESFQSTFPSTNWTIVNQDANVTWTKVTTAGGFGTSTSSARMDNYSSSTSLDGQSDYIYSPYLNLTSALAPITLKFDVAYSRYSSTYSDSLKVLITTDCGSSWTNIYSKGGTSLATAPDNASSLFVPTATQWRTETINLNSFAGNSAARISFQNLSGWGQTLYIDNINLTSGTTSVFSNDFSTSINIYPNPNNGSFNISVELEKSDDIYLKILNIVGQEISSKKISNTLGGTYAIDLTTETNGIYFVEIKTNNSKVVRKINLIK
ncbi:MAG: hypothetical protein A3F72_20900 [Bacteroidetes bacterium RIFCSPLOWO2_12_FULL_35_15]|nr:MAG: hypothetical protein A3F72_20900 [Bacteroidetes bacterium RIFCSPLOWO2_12_FULL_35_15]